VIRLDLSLSQLPLFWDGPASLWAKQQATQQLKALQPSAGEAAAATFLCVRCFAGEVDAAGEGD
jgi:hypothetical protein